MNVSDNMAFSLEMHHVPKKEREEQVQQAARMLGLEEYLQRKPKELSGGQRQRVALGRAIVREPQVFLMDEPLSNLDAQLRVATGAEIIDLHQRIPTTTIYVTHDQVEAIMQRYRSAFLGKSSPVHFFWGSFDLALTLFSGRRAPERPGADRITREGGSHEQISCGFWPGDDRFPAPAFYSYTYPGPPGLPTASIRPEEAFYSQELGEFLLRYDDVRPASSPEQALLEFFQSTYEAGAQLAQWDREALERRMR